MRGSVKIRIGTRIMYTILLRIGIGIGIVYRILLEKDCNLVF